MTPQRPSVSTRLRRAVHHALGRSPHVDLHTWALETPRLPLGHPGLRIAHMTDLHVGRVTPEARLDAAVEAVNALQPDVVCLTGDYVSHSLRYLTRLERALSRLEAPAFAVYGNHDHWNGADSVGRALSQAGVRMLVNETARLTIRGAPWRLVGLDDPVTKNHDVAAAFRDPDMAVPLVVLSHLAEATHEFATHAPALVLSGHTHGGQVCVPGYGALVTNCDLDAARVKGLSTHTAGGQTAHLHVSAGLGTSPFAPYRFACRPEATLLTMRPRSAV